MIITTCICGDPPEVICKNCNKHYCGGCNELIHKERPGKTVHTHQRVPFVDQEGTHYLKCYISFNPIDI